MTKKRRFDKGTTAVEFALVLPLFLFLVFSIEEFGRYFFAEHTLQFATREGARLACVGGTLMGANGQPLSRESSVILKIQQCLSPAINPGQVSINIYPVTSTYGNPQNWNNTDNSGTGGQYMRVTTQYTFTFLIPQIGALFPGGVELMQAQCTYRNELFN